jgi:hypothetical protein
MKTLFWIIIMSLATLAANAQKSIDALFDRYADMEGFTSVVVSGNLLKFASKLDKDKGADSDHLPAKITEIRILTQDNDEMKVDNFYDLVLKDINAQGYEEFMKVKEYDQDLRMLVKTDGERFREFLLIGGGKDNFVIQIKGDMSLKEAENFSSDIKKNHGKGML